jgi:cell division cycle 2-like protein
MQKELKEGFPITTIREINLLLGISHPNIVAIREILAGNSVDKVYVVMEYMEHELKHLMENTQHVFTWGETKSLLQQLLRGIEYLHSRNIIHRDLKPSNILYDNQGVLKICDFGLAREYNPAKQLTPVVVTLWYRAPELLLG